MKKGVFRIIGILGVLSLSSASMSAHSKTRAGDSSAFYEQSSSTPTNLEHSALAGPLPRAADFFIVLLLSSWFTGIVFVAINNKNQTSELMNSETTRFTFVDDTTENQSPGAN